MGKLQRKKLVPGACLFHDRVNLICLPILAAMSAAGLLGLYSPEKVTNMFVMYIVADFCWLYFEPEAIPSLHGVIYFHHFITLLLLLFPLVHKEFSSFTCLDGLTELNTFFMIARRCWSSQRLLMHRMYWITYVPLRLILYPALLPRFWFVLEGFPMWERVGVVTCQFLLCLFNLAMLWASLVRRTQPAASAKRRGEVLITASATTALRN
jgi:hypothetical protein